MSGITVGIDGSHHGRKALDWAMREAALRNIPLTVLTVHTVIREPWTGSPVSDPADTPDLARARAAVEHEVAEAAERLGTGQPQVTVTAINGFPAKVLIEASANSDLVVVGNRGGGGFPRLSLGGVASQVVHHAHCPVVVVPSAE
jgi:nucleotide-binding universal stress UspA family protein